MKAKQKEEQKELDQEDLKLLEEIRLFQERDIYCEEGVENLMDEEGISGEECGFMKGFIAA